eukprot:14470302-Ditylum_brightwellii.AAC.1
MAQPHTDNFHQHQIEEIIRQEIRLVKLHPDVAENHNTLALYVHHVFRNHEEALVLHARVLDIFSAQP